MGAAREIVNHSNFCHPHVIQFKEVFLTDDYLAIAMEYAPGGDLFQYVRDHAGLRVRFSSLHFSNCMHKLRITIS